MKGKTVDGRRARIYNWKSGEALGGFNGLSEKRRWYTERRAEIYTEIRKVYGKVYAFLV